MQKISMLALGGAMLVGVAMLPLVTMAQTSNTMPVLYDQNGNPVNNSNSILSAGYYYLNTGGQPNSQVYYYGNGVYYDATNGVYGGSVYNPSGMAGASLTQSTNSNTSGSSSTGSSGTTGSMSGSSTGNGVMNGTGTSGTGTNGNNGVNNSGMTPTVPNTGAGGDSGYTWITLIAAALIAIVGTTYLVKEGRSKNV